MPRTRSRPANVRFPAYSGRVLVDSFRGSMRVRKWPRKRGRPKSTLVREQNEWFAAVNRLIKLADAGQYIAAIDATKGTGVYPRDLLMHTISEGIVDIIELDGTFIQHARPGVEGVTFQGCRIQRTTAFSLLPNVVTTITWNDPVLDTAAFWNITDPTVISIPQGVTVAIIYGSFFVNAGGSGRGIGFLVSSLRGSVARLNTEVPFDQAITMNSGPLNVVEGEKFHLAVFVTGGGNMNPGPMSHLGAQIIGTT